MIFRKEGCGQGGKKAAFGSFLEYGYTLSRIGWLFCSHMNEKMYLAVAVVVLSGMAIVGGSCRDTSSEASVLDPSAVTEAASAEVCMGVWGGSSRIPYRVRFEMESVATDAYSPLPDAEGRVMLDGVLLLTDTGHFPCGNQRRLRFHSLDTVDWRVLGAAVETGRSWFGDYTAQATYDESGALQEFLFDEDAPRAWAAVMAQLLIVGQPWLLDSNQGRQITQKQDRFGMDGIQWARGLCDDRGCSWSGQALSDGDSDVLFAATSAAPTTRQGTIDAWMTRDRAGMVELKMHRRVEFLRAGQPISSMMIRAHWERLGPERLGPEVAAEEAYGSMVVWSQLDDPARRSALESRVDGLSGDEVLKTLRQHGQGGVVPEHSRWLWRVVGLLRLKPEFAETLRSSVQPDGAVWGGMGPSLVLDILANAGTDAAQRAAMELLSEQYVQQRQDYGRLIQSLVLVRYPRDWLVTGVAGLLPRLPPGPARRGAVNALGVLVGRWGKAGGVVPDAWIDQVEDCAAADAELEDYRVVLMALGNTQDARALPKLNAGVSARPAVLRLTAVRALAQMPQEIADRVSEVLLKVARTDAVPAVAAEAVRSLRSVPLDEADCPKVAELVARAQSEEPVALALVEWVSGEAVVVSGPGSETSEVVLPQNCRQKLVQQLEAAQLKGRAGHRVADLVRKRK